MPSRFPTSPNEGQPVYGLAIRSNPAYLTFVLPESRNVRQAEKADNHSLDQGPSDIAQGNPGTAALSRRDGTGGGGYPRGRVVEGEARLCAPPAERRVCLPTL